MAPLPKRKFSTKRTGTRTAAKEKALVGLVVCKECGKKKLPHRLCKYCGK